MDISYRQVDDDALRADDDMGAELSMYIIGVAYPAQVCRKANAVFLFLPGTVLGVDVKIIRSRRPQAMNRAKYIQGIVSVYDSTLARDFQNSSAYPVGLELIYHNDATSKKFTCRLLDVFREVSPESGIIYQVQGKQSEPVIGIDCFFRDAASLAVVLNKSLGETGIYHEERQNVISKAALINQAHAVCHDFCLA